MWNQLGWKWYPRSLWRRTPREMLTQPIFRYALYKNCNYVVEFPLKYFFNMTFSAVNPVSLYNPLNSSPPCAAYMRQSTWSALVQIFFSPGFISWGIINFEILFWYSKANIEMCNYYAQSTIVQCRVDCDTCIQIPTIWVCACYLLCSHIFALIFKYFEQVKINP